MDGSRSVDIRKGEQGREALPNQHASDQLASGPIAIAVGVGVGVGIGTALGVGIGTGLGVAIGVGIGLGSGITAACSRRCRP